MNKQKCKEITVDYGSHSGQLTLIVIPDFDNYGKTQSVYVPDKCLPELIAKIAKRMQKLYHHKEEDSAFRLAIDGQVFRPEI